MKLNSTAKLNIAVVNLCDGLLAHTVCGCQMMLTSLMVNVLGGACKKQLAGTPVNCYYYHYVLL